MTSCTLHKMQLSPCPVVTRLNQILLHGFSLVEATLVRGTLKFVFVSGNETDGGFRCFDSVDDGQVSRRKKKYL